MRVASILGCFASVVVACSGAHTPDEDVAQTTDDLSTSGFTLPWDVGVAHAVGQGDRGRLPDGSTSDHAMRLCNGVGQCDRLMLHAIDFEMKAGEKVRAAKDGVVVMVHAGTRPGDPCFLGDGNTGRCAGKENSVVVRYDGGALESQYLHFSEVHVRVGQKVRRGDVLGLVGSTGQSSGPHLHFQIQKPCGATMCQSVPLAFEDVKSLAPGSWPLRSPLGTRCWSDALSRYVTEACVEKVTKQGEWNVCEDGTWRAVDTTCPTSSPIYGWCVGPDGARVPPRSCRPFGNVWKQCGASYAWLDGVASYKQGVVGGPLGPCTP